MCNYHVMNVLSSRERHWWKVDEEEAVADGGVFTEIIQNVYSVRMRLDLKRIRHIGFT